MQLKSIFYVASALAVVVARATVSDVLAGITTIDYRVNALQQAVADYPPTGGSMDLAIDVHNKATATIDAINDATTTAKSFEGEVTTEISTQILNAFHVMAPLIHNGVETIIAKKDAFASIAVGRATAIVRLDLLGLLSVATDLENVLLPLTPVEHREEASALVLEINTSLHHGIDYYSEKPYPT